MKKITLFALLCISVLQLSGQTFGKSRVNKDQKTTTSLQIISPSTTMVETQLDGHPSAPTSSAFNLFGKSNRTLLTAPGNECTTALDITPPGIPACATMATTFPTGSGGASGQISGTGTTATSSVTTPLPASGCGFYAGFTPDVWYSITVPAGAQGFQVSTAMLAASSGFYGTTTYSSVSCQVYSGSCAALTAVGACNTLLEAYRTTGTCAAPTGGLTLGGPYVATYQGLAPGTYYIRVFTYRERNCIAQDGTTGNSFVQDNWFLSDFKTNLLPPPPANESCNACISNPTNGCNLGAPNEYSTWSGPSALTTAMPPGLGTAAAPYLCGTNAWSSVDNPVYFCFTAAAANPSITVNGITCNGSATGGVAQFAAFSSCASITGTAAMWNGSNFFGCAAGNGTVTLNTTGIAPNQSFIVVVDGNAGDGCVWSFQTAGVLPLEMMNFAGYKERSANILNWTTANEVNNDHFMVEKSLDGTKYETLGKVSSTAKGNQKQSYSFSDERPNSGITYYRLKQIGTDGSETYSQVISITRKDEKFAIHNFFPSPAVQSMTLEFESVATAPVEARIIDSYGRMLKNFRIESVRNGINYFQIDELSDLSQGMYFLQLSNGSEQILQRFIKN